MRKKHQIIYLVFAMLLGYTNAFSQYQRKGLVYVINTTPPMYHTLKKDTLVKQENKIWFKDSCVIYEVRTNLETSESVYEGTIVKKSYPVLKYIFLNLKTMVCQDYHNLKDTAMPFCNYSIKPTDTLVVWDFFARPKESDTLHGIFYMKDTVMNGITYKRVKILYKYYEYVKYYTVYYFDCKAKQNIFHINRTLSNMYPNCKLNKLDFCDSTSKVIYRKEWKVNRDKLTTDEETIFKKWYKNATSTKLPLITYSDALRIPIKNPEHENPTITFIQNEKR